MNSDTNSIIKKLFKEFHRLSPGINSPGGKWRLLFEVLMRMPKHDFYLEPFIGSGLISINKPRCRYEIFNDKYYEIYNYFYVLKYHYSEFRKAIKGLFELVCEKLYEDIQNEIVIPRNRVEQAVIFRYMNKLTRAGLNQLVEKDFRGLFPPTNTKKNVIEKIKQEYANPNLFKGVRVNNTRPYTNNDNGLCTPIDFRVKDRLKYVTLTCQDFRDVYQTFYQKYHVERGLTKECFMYWDPVYPGKGHPYFHQFTDEDHFDVIEILLDTPFNFELSIGGECELYLDAFKEAGFYIDPIKTKYSMNAQHQKNTQEYIIMNYDIKKVPTMPLKSINPDQKQLSVFMEG